MEQVIDSSSVTECGRNLRDCHDTQHKQYRAVCVTRGTARHAYVNDAGLQTMTCSSIGYAYHAFY